MGLKTTALSILLAAAILGATEAHVSDIDSIFNHSIVLLNFYTVYLSLSVFLFEDPLMTSPATF